MIKIDPSDLILKVLIKIIRIEKTRGLSSHSMEVYSLLEILVISHYPIFRIISNAPKTSSFGQISMLGRIDFLGNVCTKT